MDEQRKQQRSSGGTNGTPRQKPRSSQQRPPQQKPQNRRQQPPRRTAEQDREIRERQPQQQNSQRQRPAQQRNQERPSSPRQQSKRTYENSQQFRPQQSAEQENRLPQRRPTQRPLPQRPAQNQLPRNGNEHSRKMTPPKKRRRINASSVIAVLILFLAFYLVITLLIIGFVMYSFHNSADTADLYSISVVYDENKLFALDAAEANNEYGLYIPFEYLAEISSFGLLGNDDKMTLVINGTQNHIDCTVNSSLIVINDNPVRLASPILYKDGEYLIPIDLIENYVSGIDVTYNTEKMVCTVSTDLGKTDVSLNILLPEPVVPPEFSDEDRYYGSHRPGSDNSDSSDDTVTSDDTDNSQTSED